MSDTASTIISTTENNNFFSLPPPISVDLKKIKRFDDLESSGGTDW